MMKEKKEKHRNTMQIEQMLKFPKAWNLYIEW